MIKVENLSKAFGPKVAVNRISFTVERGEVLGFLGPNGAGKSTTMRMITGFIPPSEGRVTVGGFDMINDPIPAKRLIGYLPENAPAYNDMTVTGFLGFIAELRGLHGDAKKKAIQRVIEMCFLESVRFQSVDTLSKGYRHRTCFAQSILHDPDVLVLDEPTDGLDPNQKHEVRGLIRRMGERKAIIFSTHILEEVEAVCSRAIIIDCGQIVANGTPQELKLKSDAAGAVFLVVRGVAGAQLVERLGAVPNARRAAIVKEEQGKVWARVYPKSENRNGDLARNVMAATTSWQVEELHTEEGRLDEVFRSITLPEMARRIQEMNSFSNIKAITKRELAGYFSSPVAYVFIVIFLLLMGFFTFMAGEFFEHGQATLEHSFFMWHPWLYLFLVPAVGMRLWAEERRVGTLELLFTLPITVWQAIVGKFLASWLFLLLALILTFPVVITVNYLGSPDNGVILAGYVGSFLMAGSYLAISCMTSAMTRNQVVSFILSSVTCLVLVMCGWPPVTNLFARMDSPWLVNTVAAFSVITHFEYFTKGVLDSRDVIFFLSLIGFSLFTTGVILRSHRAG